MISDEQRRKAAAVLVDLAEDEGVDDHVRLTAASTLLYEPKGSPEELAEAVRDLVASELEARLPEQ